MYWQEILIKLIFCICITFILAMVLWTLSIIAYSIYGDMIEKRIKINEFRKKWK